MVMFWALVLIIVAGLGLLASIAYVVNTHRSPEPVPETIAAAPSGLVSFFVKTKTGKVVAGNSVDVTLTDGETDYPVSYDPVSRMFMARNITTDNQLEATVTHGDNVTKKVVELGKPDVIILNDYFSEVVLVNNTLEIRGHSLSFDIENLGAGEYRAQSGVLFWDNSSLTLEEISVKENELWDAGRDHQGVSVYSGMTVPFRKDLKLEENGRQEKITFTFSREVRDIHTVTLKLFSDYEVDQIVAVTIED